MGGRRPTLPGQTGQLVGPAPSIGSQSSTGQVGRGPVPSTQAGICPSPAGPAVYLQDQGQQQALGSNPQGLHRPGGWGLSGVCTAGGGGSPRQPPRTLHHTPLLDPQDSKVPKGPGGVVACLKLAAKDRRLAFQGSSREAKQGRLQPGTSLAFQPTWPTPLEGSGAGLPTARLPGRGQTRGHRPTAASGARSLAPMEKKTPFRRMRGHMRKPSLTAESGGCEPPSNTPAPLPAGGPL